MNKKIPEKKFRLDMKETLYNRILEYSNNKSLGGRTKGEQILIAIEEMYNIVQITLLENSVLLTEENKKILSGFQNLGVLSGQDLSSIVNEALAIYIQEHKEDLKNKIEKL